MINKQLLEKQDYSRFYSLLTDAELVECDVTWNDEQSAARRNEVENRRRIKEQEQARIHQERMERLQARKEAVQYSDALATEICERIASGELLTVICLDEYMPAMRMCSQWLREHSDFNAYYQHSLWECLSVFEDDLVSIADQAARDFDEIKSKGSVRRVIDPGKLQAAKLRVECRRLHLKAGNPAKWGETSTLITKSADGFDPANMSAEELEREIAQTEYKSRIAKSAA